MKLADWLKTNHITKKELAHQIGTHPLSVRRYLKGERKPTDEVMLKIIEVTNGSVMPNDFYSVPKTEKLQGAAA